jgi:hypothetical protein
MRDTYYSDRCKWGELFGLRPSDLTEEQLSKVQFKKLIEMLPEDKRVEKVIAKSIFKCDVADINHIRYFEKSDIDKMPVFIEAYNNFVKYRQKDFENNSKRYWGPSRLTYVKWEFLNNSGRAREIARYLNNQDSIVDISKVDFDWLCTEYPWLAHKMIRKIISLGHNHRIHNTSAPLPRMISILPYDFLVQHIDSIFDKCGNSAAAYVLSNPNTPKKYIIKGLRAIAGRIKIPKINMTISKNILESLPPVKRLETLETLLVHTSSKVKFEDIESSDDLKTLLFGTSIRYNERVRTVINMFKRIYEPYYRRVKNEYV